MEAEGLAQHGAVHPRVRRLAQVVKRAVQELSGQPMGQIGERLARLRVACVRAGKRAGQLLVPQGLDPPDQRAGQGSRGAGIERRGGP